MAQPDIQRLQELFTQARQLPAGERDSFLDHACGSNDKLRIAVEDLLEHDNSELIHDAPLPLTQPLAEAIRDQPTAPKKSNGGRPQKPQIGPYKLIKKIGQGGMGTVFLAEQKKPVRRRVALKLIRKGRSDKRILSRFEAERQALAMMDHANIARILDAGTTEGGSPYFVMELVDGVPISNYCDQNQLSARQRLELFIPVCNAVQHAHQKGIIHRDLKPSNVLVATQDDKPLVKVIDFGLAKALQPQLKLTEETMYTEFGQIMGTLQYMSPEQAGANGEDVDTRADIYALGSILYKLLTGFTPIDNDSMRQNALDEIYRMIREQDPPRPSKRLTDSSTNSKIVGSNTQSWKSSLRNELDWVVMCAIHKDRDQRYATVAALSEDVQNYLNGEPVEARPPSLWYQFNKLVGRNKGLAATLVTVATVLVFSLATISWFALKTNEALSQAKKETVRATQAEVKQRKAAELASRREAEKGELSEALREKVDQLEMQTNAANNNATLAEANAIDAERRKKEAELQAQRAESQRKKAEIQTRLAEKAREKVVWNEYKYGIQNASKSLNESELYAAWNFLLSTPTQYRDLEFDLLKDKLNDLHNLPGRYFFIDFDDEREALLTATLKVVRRWNLDDLSESTTILDVNNPVGWEKQWKRGMRIVGMAVLGGELHVELRVDSSSLLSTEGLEVHAAEPVLLLAIDLSNGAISHRRHSDRFFSSNRVYDSQKTWLVEGGSQYLTWKNNLSKDGKYHAAILEWPSRKEIFRISSQPGWEMGNFGGQPVSPDGKYFVTTESQIVPDSKEKVSHRKVQHTIWHIEKRAKAFSIEGDEYSNRMPVSTKISWSKDSKHLYQCLEKQVFVWNVLTEDIDDEFITHSFIPSFCVELGSDVYLLFDEFEKVDQKVYVFDRNNSTLKYELVKNIERCAGCILSDGLRKSRKNTHVALIKRSGEVFVWNVATLTDLNGRKDLLRHARGYRFANENNKLVLYDDREDTSTVLKFKSSQAKTIVDYKTDGDIEAKTLFSCGGRWLLGDFRSGKKDDRFLQELLWDVKNGNLVNYRESAIGTKLHPRSQFINDRYFVAWKFDDPRMLELYKIGENSIKRLCVIETTTTDLESTHTSPGEKYWLLRFASEIRIVNCHTGESHKFLENHPELKTLGIADLNFLSDEQIVVSFPYSFEIWQLTPLTLVERFPTYPTNTYDTSVFASKSKSRIKIKNRVFDRSSTEQVVNFGDLVFQPAKTTSNRGWRLLPICPQTIEKIEIGRSTEVFTAMGQNAVYKKEVNSGATDGIFSHSGLVVDSVSDDTRQQLFTLTEDQKIHLWDVPAAKIIAELRLSFKADKLRLLDDVQQIVAWGDGKAEVFDANDLGRVETRNIPEISDSWMVLSDAEWTWSGRWKNQIKLIKDGKPNVIHLQETNSNLIHAFGGDMAAYACDDGKIRLIDLKLGDVIHELPVDLAELRKLTISDNGKFLAGYFNGYRFQAWELSEGKPFFEIFDRFPEIASFQISDDGSRIVFSGEDKTLGVIRTDLKLLPIDSSNSNTTVADAFELPTGFFRRNESDGKQWVETNVKGVPQFNFSEILQNQKYIQVRDESRNLDIRFPLNGGKSSMSTDGGKTWTEWYVVKKINPTDSNSVPSGSK